MAPVLIVLVASTLASTASRPPVLKVMPAAEDAASACDAAAALTRAIRRVLPDVRLEAPEPGAQGEEVLQASLTFRDPGWALLVTRSDGEAVLSRTFEGNRDECQRIADASAVIIERYYTDLAWTGAAVAVAPLAPEDGFFQGLSVSAGLTVQPPVAAPAATGAELSVSARLGARAFAQVGLWTALTERLATVVIQRRDRGTLHARAAAAFAAGGLCFGGPDGLDLCAGPFAGAYALEGSAEGNLYRVRSQRTLAPVVGALVQATQALPARLELGGAIRVGVLPSPPEVVVEGTSASLRASTVDLQVGVRLGWRIF